MWAAEMCERCVTTHPIDPMTNQRTCPNPPPIASQAAGEKNHFASIGLGTGSCPTRGYGRSQYAPAYGGNPGHQPPTAADMGLSNSDLKELNIR